MTKPTLLPFPPDDAPLYGSPEERPLRPRRKRRLNPRRLVIAFCLLYLLGLTAWGVFTNMRVGREEAQLRAAVKKEQQANSGLKTELANMTGTRGAEAQVQEQLNLVPKGQIPVVIQGTSPTR